MKVLLCHNYYQQRGGEDVSFEAEAALLEAHGHEVLRHTVHNDEIRQRNGLAVGLQSIWNRAACRGLVALLRRERPQLVHFHNTFPLLSAAVYRAVSAEGVAVVKTLHNYRPLCPAAILFRDGNLCLECVGKAVAWPAVRHGCYRESRLHSAAVAAGNAVHRASRTWQEHVDLFLLAGTDVMKQRYAQGGFPSDRLHCKPNFLWPDPGAGPGAGNYVAYVGRLEAAKGLPELVAAWERTEGLPPLKLVGDGPLLAELRERARRSARIEACGRRSLDETLDILRNARLMVFPSRLPEGMPRTIIEAFACGTPVLAAQTGAAESMVRVDETGAFFTAGSSGDLSRKALAMLLDRERLLRMRRAARIEFEARYTADRNHDLLMAAYEQALRNRATRRTP